MIQIFRQAIIEDSAGKLRAIGCTENNLNEQITKKTAVMICEALTQYRKNKYFYIAAADSAAYWEPEPLSSNEQVVVEVYRCKRTVLAYANNIEVAEMIYEALTQYREARKESDDYTYFYDDSSEYFGCDD